MKRIFNLVFIGFSILALPVVSHAEAVPFGAVQTILAAKCFMCHTGPSARGGVNLETYDTMIATSKLVVKGDPDQSLLYRAVGADAPKRMPLIGANLTDEEMDTLRNWITEGAENS